MEKRLIVRALSLEDDLIQVARLIYDTDEYIFPYLYESDLQKAERVIVKMIQRDTIYNYRNITVATLDEKIVGLIVAKETPIFVDAGEMIRCFIDSNEIVGERFTKTFNEYYKLFEDEPEGVYIANVCVDKTCRGEGIGKKLLAAFLQKNPTKTYHLETVKENIAALKVYQACGFEITKEYLGFMDVPCYRMMR